MAEADDKTNVNLSQSSEEFSETKKCKSLRKRFTAKRVALMAVFVALGYVISLLEFSLFPSTPAAFLKLDFGNTLILLISFLLGPVEGVIVCVLKELLRIPFPNPTGGVGELANIIMTSSYILLPSVLYRFKKGLKVVIPALIVGGLIATSAALLVNRFILIPFYGIPNAGEFFKGVWGYIAAFNLIKTSAISLLTMLLYKRLSDFLKKFKI